MRLPAEAPVMILPATTLFPLAVLPLLIFEPRYRRMLADVLESHRMFCIAMRKPGPHQERALAIAGIGLVRASMQNPDGTSNLLLQGVARVSLGPAVRYQPYRVYPIRPLETPSADDVTTDALVAKIHELVTVRVQQDLSALTIPNAPKIGSKQSAFSESLRLLIQKLTTLTAPDQLADMVTWTLLPNPLQRQLILETAEIEPRLRHVIHFLMAEIQRHRKNPAHE